MKAIHLRPRSGWVRVGLAILYCLLPGPIGAQEPVKIEITALRPQEALSKLESGDQRTLNGAAAVITAAFGQNLDKYTPAQRRELLDGVERLALGQADTGEAPERAVRTAFAILNTLALDPSIKPVERREIPGRLMRIFHQSQSRECRTLAVYSLGEILASAPTEAPAIGRILTSVASGSPGPGSVPPRAALDALLNAGEQGVPLLRWLHDEGSVQDAEVRAFLNEHARRGYPVRRKGGV